MKLTALHQHPNYLPLSTFVETRFKRNFEKSLRSQPWLQFFLYVRTKQLLGDVSSPLETPFLYHNSNDCDCIDIDWWWLWWRLLGDGYGESTLIGRDYGDVDR